MNSKQKLIVGNWKMHKTVAETQQYLQQLGDVTVWLALPYTDLAAASALVKGTKIEIGAQNMSDQLAGAFTGEISANMIREAGASFVLLGHSERRHIFHEEDALINRKVKCALDAHFKVILCVGETEAQHAAGESASIIQGQLKSCLEGVLRNQRKNVLIAYEPVWAIGTNHPATAEIVEKIHHMCKDCLANSWGLTIEEIKLLYGGSVSPSNARQFLALPTVDGLLVGSASLDAGSFREIIQVGEDV